MMKKLIVPFTILAAILVVQPISSAHAELTDEEKTEIIKENYPDASDEKVQKAIDHPVRTKRAHKIKKNYPNASKKQVRRHVRHPKMTKARHKHNQTYN